MEIILCTIPLRNSQGDGPPFGAIALMQTMLRAGYDPYFYDIDGWRPSLDEAVKFIQERAPDVLAISAVVSTAYAYTKKLALAVKQASPNIKIVVGGNLAASAELLLRFCKVDVCGIGEGETVLPNLLKYWEDHPGENDYSELRKIQGLTYLDSSGDVEFTGYEVAIPANDFFDPDYSIMEQYCTFDNFLPDPLHRYDFSQDVRSYEPHRLGKRLGNVHTAKGCVAKCTFCHRWDRGYRHWPVDRIMDNIHHLMDRYNVGFISFNAENFGSDRKKLDELIERVKPLDLLYKVSGVRVATVDEDLIHRMKESGCVSMYYGMETGSPTILQVMEKNATLEQNINAARWTYEAGIYTVYQMVLGMPGEDTQTIAETSEFIKSVTEFLPEPPNKRLSINYIQALPGTPVYEYARNIGLIGNTLEDEERYLLLISNTNAADDSKFLNFTKHDYFTVQSWRPRIVFDAEANWYQKNNWQSAPNTAAAAKLNSNMPKTEADEDNSRGGYFNMGHAFFVRHPLFYRILSSRIGYPLRLMYPVVFVLAKDVKRMKKWTMLRHIKDFFVFRIKRPTELKDRRSLRQVMKSRSGDPATKTEESMRPLRDGR